MRLEYADRKLRRYVNITDPTFQQFEEAIEGLDTKDRSEIHLFINYPWRMQISVDNSNVRILLCYVESSQDSLFRQEHCVVDPSLLNQADKEVEFNAANGEEYHAKLYETITRAVAIPVALYIFEHKSAPDFVTWKKFKL